VPWGCDLKVHGIDRGARFGGLRGGGQKGHTPEGRRNFHINLPWRGSQKKREWPTRHSKMTTPSQENPEEAPNGLHAPRIHVRRDAAMWNWRDRSKTPERGSAHFPFLGNSRHTPQNASNRHQIGRPDPPGDASGMRLLSKSPARSPSKIVTPPRVSEVTGSPPLTAT
jgi:hypothetical protein